MKLIGQKKEFIEILNVGDLIYVKKIREITFIV